MIGAGLTFDQAAGGALAALCALWAAVAYVLDYWNRGEK